MPEAPSPQQAANLRRALGRTLLKRAVAQGSITLPAVPDLLEEYLSLCLDTFAALGVRFDDAQHAHLRQVLSSQLAEAFAASQRSEIVITYDVPVGSMVNYHVSPRWRTIEETYDNWTALREPPYFGPEPDARVMQLAGELPANAPILDLGAGTGRNALALARLGHPVDAVEASGRFADELRSAAQAASLPVAVIQRDALADAEDRRRDYGLIVLSEVVTDFRTVDQLRRLFHLAATCLAPDGRLVLNAFLPRGDYEPDAAARQLGEQVYSALFTRPEVLEAAAAFGLELLDDAATLEFERAHLPAQAWPPTNWYEKWAAGLDLFAVADESSPIELRWLVFGKAAQSSGPQPSGTKRRRERGRRGG